MFIRKFADIYLFLKAVIFIIMSLETYLSVMYEEIPVVVIQTIINFTWSESASDALRFSYDMIQRAKTGDIEFIRSLIEDGVAPIGIDYDGKSKKKIFHKHKKINVFKVHVK